MIHSVHLSTAQSWRGGENQIYLLARGLRAMGHRAVVVAPPGSPLLERCIAESIETRPLHVCGELDLIGAGKLASLLRKLRPDVLHLHDGHAVLPGKWAARLSFLRDIKVVAHRRTVFKLRGRGKFGGRIDRVIAISSAVKEELLKAGIPSEKIRVVYSGMDFPEPLAPKAPDVVALRERHGIPLDAFVIAHAAALTSEKRQADMLAAVALANKECAARGQAPVHLAIAGSGTLQNVLMDNALKSGQSSHVHFLGFLNDLRPVWAMASMALYASEAEGLCTALIEAQGAGLPAAISRAGGMTEVVEDRETGVIFNVGATDEMSRAILALRNDSAERARMGRNAGARARSLFSSNAMVEGVVKAYEDLGVRG